MPRIVINHPFFERLEETDWITIFPFKDTITLNCQNQEEVIEVTGTYLINIPLDCWLKSSQIKILNKNDTEIPGQPILYPALKFDTSYAPTSTTSIKLQEIKLDDLKEIKSKLADNDPELNFQEIYSRPSVWTIIIYCLLILIGGAIVGKKLHSQWMQPTEDHPIDLASVQLPR